jgi:YD repeat-containing protein
MTVLNTLNHRAIAKVDANYNVNQYSFNDMAFQGDNGGGSNLIYIGMARAGSSTAQPVWQIRKISYDGSGNILTITWPINSNGAVSTENQFIWTSRTTYTYQ